MKTALVAVTLLLTACTAAGPPTGATTDTAPPHTEAPEDLGAARAAASLAPCPAAGPSSGSLPDLALACLGGGSDVALRGLTGAPTVINVWATWCGPCKEELPAVQAFASAAGSKVRVIAVASQEARMTDPLQFAAAEKITIPMLYDADGALRQAERAAGMPFTLFVRADGSLAGEHIGPLTGDTLRTSVQKFFGVSVG